VFMFSQPALFGELAIMLWLVIKGATPLSPSREQASLSSWAPQARRACP